MASIAGTTAPLGPLCDHHLCQLRLRGLERGDRGDCPAGGCLAASFGRSLHAREGYDALLAVDDGDAHADTQLPRLCLSCTNHVLRAIAWDWLGLFLAAAEERCVDLREILPFLRQIAIEKDCLYWADEHALLTLDADIRVDIVLRLLGCRMNAVDRTDLDAGAVLHLDARLSDDIRHSAVLKLPSLE